MKRIIDFDVSISGLPSQVIRIEYESYWKSFDEIESSTYSQYKDVLPEAVRALEKEIGHNDIEIVYWNWIV